MSKLLNPSGLLNYARRQRLKALPGVMTFYFKLFSRRKLHQLTTEATRLCLEGFPRSGNSFSYLCIVTLFDIPAGAISHHTHSPANVRRAVRRGLPTYVFIREPKAACMSLLLYGACETLEESMESYEVFYRPLLALLDRVTIVPFELFIQDPTDFLDRIADDFNQERVQWTPEVAASMDDIVRRADEQFQVAQFERNSLPTAEKERQKAELARAELTPKADERLARCMALREEILKKAPVVIGAAQAR